MLNLTVESVWLSSDVGVFKLRMNFAVSPYFSLHVGVINVLDNCWKLGYLLLLANVFGWEVIASLSQKFSSV